MNKIILLVILCVSLTAFAEDEYKVEIVRVVDGDTVDVNVNLGFNIWMMKERVRLNGIDTPESRTRDLVEKRYGLQSKEKLKELLHSPVTLLVYGKGKFGRILGDFRFSDGTSVVDTMIEECHGVKYHGQNKTEVQAAHLINRECLKNKE